MTIFLQFLRALRRCLNEHLYLQPYINGTYRLTITPWTQQTFNKIRLCLSWVEGHRVLYLGNAQINELFIKYCFEWCYNHYVRREKGFTNLMNTVPG